MISQDRLEKALTFLAETDEDCASLKADAARAEFKAKAVRDAIFLREEGTVAERTARSGASKEYAAAMGLHFDLLERYEGMRNKRGTEAIVIDTWRSLNASRRAGNVT